MDRRDALKKLGVGGAVAVAAPVLLDSFNVASAASPSLLHDVQTAVGETTDWINQATRTRAGNRQTLNFTPPANNVPDSSVGFSYLVTNSLTLSISGTTLQVSNGSQVLPSPFTLTVIVTWTRGEDVVSATYAFLYTSTGNGSGQFTFVPSVVAVPA
jgi:hypothetical protein